MFVEKTFAVVPLALAHLAWDGHVWQELHLDLDVDALPNRSGDTSPEREQRHLPPVFLAQRRIGAKDERRIVHEPRIRVLPFAFEVAANVAGGDPHTR